ncbi:hypothetical protein EVG20_g11478 [Dentipellis fragilis]|uniref:Uncharacterized protein n=1 Tax=Dentipellis fragilis TaxID=205917 RepID=A0A4Y9XMC3_9AGAM|nr:hypothetical protein EVG20_g11478 [Dentipellis fragilis]
MQPHQYLQTNSFPDVDFYRSQSSSRPPSREQVTNIFQQIPARVPNLGSGYAGYAAAPPLYNSATYSPGHASTRSVTPEPWEAATSEFQVPAYQHEMPASHYESQFSPTVGLHETRAEGEENAIRTDDSSTPKTRTNKARTAEQKARMAKSAANRRANDKDHLSIIKERLPPLGYGQEYNNRTALAGAIARFDEDEETIRSLKEERSAIECRLGHIEEQLASEKRKRESLTAERAQLWEKLTRTQFALENIKATLSIRDVALANIQIELMNKNTELQNKDLLYNEVYTRMQHSEAKLRYLKEQYRLP